jgi:hypothetical protein
MQTGYEKKAIEIQVGEVGTVKLNGCSGCALDSIMSLSRLNVRGHLILWDCSNINKLPDCLNVVWDLCLQSCENLTKLPDDLKVGRNLYIYGCIKLKKLPESLQVGDLILYNVFTGFRRSDPGIPFHLLDKITDVGKK